MEDEAEYIQLTIPEAFVFKIPPRTSAQGHKASDWKDQVGVVKVQVVTKGKDAAIKLYRNDNGKLFAVCPIRQGGPQAVEATTDSSRYFALRLENAAGQVAYVGVGFNKREDAFDLKSALADHSKQVEVEEKGMDLGLDGVAESLGLAAGALGGAGAGGLDLSLKEGQTLQIKIGGKLGGSSSLLGSGASSGGSVRWRSAAIGRPRKAGATRHETSSSASTGACPCRLSVGDFLSWLACAWLCLLVVERRPWSVS